MAFRCPGDRKKRGLDEALCGGFMAAQLMDSEKGKYLVYCSKCSKFFVAVPTDGIYTLTEIDKRDINFIPAPFTLEGHVHGK